MIGALDTVTGYRDWSTRYDAEDNSLIAAEEPVVLPIVSALPPGRALDAACGTGRYSAHLTVRGHRVVGVDSSPDMLARARQNVPSATFTAGPAGSGVRGAALATQPVRRWAMVAQVGGGLRCGVRAHPGSDHLALPGASRGFGGAQGT